jgi:DNA-binding FrmR family transcriptional regulator
MDRTSSPSIVNRQCGAGKEKENLDKNPVSHHHRSAPMKKSRLPKDRHFAGKHTKTLLVINRLSRNEGHIRAIKRMLREERPCPDVLLQLAAVKSAVQKAAQTVLEDHVESCLRQAAVRGNTDKEWSNLKGALDKYIA